MPKPALYKALVHAQREARALYKDAENKHHSYAYTSAESIINEARTGRRVVVCPAQTSAKLTCADCHLCAIPQRKAIIGFRAHGQMSKHVDGLLQLTKRPR